MSFSAQTLFPKFGPNIHDYVVRCNNAPVTVQGHASGGWEAAIGNNPFRSGDFSQVVPLGSGRAFTITVREAGRTQLYRYYVRCLPNNFPEYTFTRYGPVSPQYFSVDREFTSHARRYGIIFDNHGVPIWWIPRSGLGHQGASERERPLVRSRLFAADGRSTASTGASSAPWMPLAARPTPTTCSYWATATT